MGWIFHYKPTNPLHGRNYPWNFFLRILWDFHESSSQQKLHKHDTFSFLFRSGQRNRDEQMVKWAVSYYFGYVARCIAYRQARGKWAAPSYNLLNCTQARSFKANRFHPPPNYSCTVGCGMGRGPGGWYSTNVYTGRLSSHWLGPTHYPFIYHFSRKRYSVPLSYIFYWQMVPRYTYLV